MKSLQNTSLCQLLTCLTYIVPMLDTVFGDGFYLGVVEGHSDAIEPMHSVDIELADLGHTIQIRVETVRDTRYFIAYGSVLPDHGVSEFVSKSPASLIESCRSFTLALQAELKTGLLASLAVARQQIEALNKLDLE